MTSEQALQVSAIEQPHWTSIVEALRSRALEEPNTRAYTFLTDGDSKEIHLNYGELDRRARAVASLLRSMNADDEPVLLVFPTGLEFIAAFFGCLYAGSIAVGVNPPRPNRSMERFGVVAHDSGTRVALTLDAVRSRIEPASEEVPGLENLDWIAIEDIDTHGENDWIDPDIDENTLAFLQYTSGSTAMPKGTMVSHGNILHNSKIIEQAFQHTRNSVGFGWLPMTHDMGLIGNIIQPLYVGFPYTFISPEHFLMKPIRWLRGISRYRANTSGGPNFAYDYCAGRIRPEDLVGLDLSNWDLAFSGAEPVRQDTINRFATKFSEYGFARSAFYPCYGLAEATLMVTGGEKSSPPVEKLLDAEALGSKRAVPMSENSRQLRSTIGCGRAWAGQRLLIVDPETNQACPDGHIGEIWVSGPSVARGYWNQPQDTDAVFRGYLQNSDDGPYLRTGDLGFIQDEDLFITGRLKDLIIIAGTNHFPADIELTVENSHPAIKTNCVAAFELETNGTQSLGIVAELDRRFSNEIERSGSNDGFDSVNDAIRSAVASGHDLSAHAICLIKQSTIPKTSGGKIQRHKCRQQYEAGELTLVRSDTSGLSDA